MSIIVSVNKIDPIIHEICPNLYLGNKDSRYLIKKFNINVIIEIGDKEEIQEYFPINNVSDEEYIIKTFILSDCRTEILPLEEFFDFIKNKIKDNTQKKILIHCNAGVSRSVSFVLAYLMKYDGIKLREGLNFLRTIRGNKIYSHPNIGFIRQLIKYEKNLFNENSLTINKYLSLN